MEFKGIRAQYEALKDSIEPAALSALLQGDYILGAQVEKLEHELASYAGRQHCVACGNGTDALILAMMLKGIGSGDGVLMPAFTCFAPAAAVLARAAVPILVDIDAETFNMSPKSLENAIGEAMADGSTLPKAALVIDMFGLPADFPKIDSIVRSHGLVLIEDAAQGLGGSIGGRMACSFGDLAITSFYPGKPLSCAGDGGAVFADSDEDASALRSLRTFGSTSEDRYVNARAGVNSRLDTVQAAILIEKIGPLREAELPKMSSIASIYGDSLRDFVKVPRVPEGFSTSWAQYTIMTESRSERDGLKSHLDRLGVPSAVHYPLPLHFQGAMRGRFFQPVRLEESEKSAACSLSLPIHAYLSDCDIDTVIGAVISYYRSR